jgi:hypothetical protein
MKYWIVGTLLVVLAAVAWYLYDTAAPTVEETVVPGPTLPLQEREPPPEVTAPEVTEPAIAEPLPESEPLAGEPALPALAESDDEALRSLSEVVDGTTPVERYVVEEDVIARIVATVDALDGKQVPEAIQAVQGPGGAFEATPDDQPDEVILNDLGDPVPQFQLNPANYRRYTPYVAMLESVNADGLARAYRAYQPLFEEAFDQLGYPDSDFEERLLKVIDDALAAPEPERPLQLIKPEAYFLFADEDLEALNAAQKVMLRMGPDNAARVKAKLAEIRAALAADERG